MLTVEGALAAAATLVAVAFALSTLDRWLARHRRHELAWTVALGMFATASGALWLGAAKGWDAPTFRVFFLFGAVLNVPVLALGTVYLLAGTRVGDRCAAAIGLAGAFAAGVVTVAPLRAAVPVDGLPKGSDLFGVLPRVLAAVGSGAGALVVLAGAVLSAVRYRRARTERGAGRLALGNLLIAVGTLVLGASGLVSGRLGEMTAFAVTLTVGIAVLFAGFLVVTTTARPAPDAGRGSAQDAPEHLAGQALR